MPSGPSPYSSPPESSSRGRWYRGRESEAWRASGFVAACKPILLGLGATAVGAALWTNGCQPSSQPVPGTAESAALATPAEDPSDHAHSRARAVGLLPPLPPPDREENHALSPGDDHVWSPGYWRWQSDLRSYAWEAGYWQDMRAHTSVAPPPTRHEDLGPTPDPTLFVSAGYWRWDGHTYVWVPGHWQPKREGYEFIPWQWHHTSGRYQPRGGVWRTRSASVGGNAVARGVPPPARAENQGLAPSYHHVWSHGYWRWDLSRDGYTWERGTWEDSHARPRVGPPPLRRERPGSPPGDGYVYAPGHWRYQGHGYVWAPGHWAVRSHDQRLIPSRWVKAGNHWEHQRPRWEPHAPPHDVRPGARPVPPRPRKDDTRPPGGRGEGRGHPDDRR